MQKYNILSGILSLVLVLNVPLQAQTSQPDATHQQQTKTLALALGVTSALAVVAVIAFAAGKSNALANVRQRRKIVFKDEHSYLNAEGNEIIDGMIDNLGSDDKRPSNSLYKPLNDALNELRAHNKGATLVIELKDTTMKRYIIPNSRTNTLNLRILVTSNALTMDNSASDKISHILHPIAVLHDKFVFPKMEDLKQPASSIAPHKHEFDGFWDISLDED